MKVIIIYLLVIGFGITFYNQHGLRGTVMAEAQKLTPVYSESRCFVLEMPEDKK